MINVIDKANCCGCNACGDVCPKQAISYKIDKEGFWYPEINVQKCIDCGLCEKVCPEIHCKEIKQDNSVPECFVAIHKNLEIRFDSTSGGLFSAFAESFIKDGGYVGGAVYTDNWDVRWLITDNIDDIPKLRSSKYLQSDSQGMYNRIKDLVCSGNKVLICALPCQIAAIRLFLGKDYDNLFLVELICRYINSPLAYHKYLEQLEKEYGGKVVYIKAKNKELGWRKLTHKCVFSNNKSYYGTIDNDIFMKASMKLNCLSRPSCYSCSFKGFPRFGDVTIGDFWTKSKKSKLDDDAGTSVVLVNSNKGKYLFEKIQKRVITEKVELEKVIAGNGALIKPLKQSKVSRESFFERIDKEDFRYVVESMSKEIESQGTSFKSKIVKIGRDIYSYIKTFRKAFKYSQFHIKPLIQFVWLNYFHPAVQSDIKKGFCIFPTPYSIFEINKKASIELRGDLIFGRSVFKKSRVETRIRMQEGSKMIIGGHYGFGYGSDVEIFKNAYFESKGGLQTNSFTTIICQEKIVIGENVACGRNVTLRDNNGGHLISINGYRNSMPIIIGDHVWLTQSVIIMSGVKIGDGTIISAGTLVNSSFPARCVVGGSPAHITQRDIYWKM